MRNHVCETLAMNRTRLRLESVYAALLIAIGCMATDTFHFPGIQQSMNGKLIGNHHQIRRDFAPGGSGRPTRSSTGNPCSYSSIHSSKQEDPSNSKNTVRFVGYGERFSMYEKEDFTDAAGDCNTRIHFHTIVPSSTDPDSHTDIPTDQLSEAAIIDQKFIEEYINPMKPDSEENQGLGSLAALDNDNRSHRIPVTSPFNPPHSAISANIQSTRTQNNIPIEYRRNARYIMFPNAHDSDRTWGHSLKPNPGEGQVEDGSNDETKTTGRWTGESQDERSTRYVGPLEQPSANTRMKQQQQQTVRAAEVKNVYRPPGRPMPKGSARKHSSSSGQGIQKHKNRFQKAKEKLEHLAAKKKRIKFMYKKKIKSMDRASKNKKSKIKAMKKKKLEAVDKKMKRTSKAKKNAFKKLVKSYMRQKLKNFKKKFSKDKGNGKEKRSSGELARMESYQSCKKKIYGEPHP